MPKRKPYARIAITLPAQELAAADRLARSQDRSRSWIIAEAIRRYSASTNPPQSPGLGEQRLSQLRADLALPVARRLGAAERTRRQGLSFRRVREPVTPENPPPELPEYSIPVALVARCLNDHQARYVVVGAVALQLWGTTRATEDIDILIEPTVANAQRVLDALATIGFGFSTEFLPEEVVQKTWTIIGDSPRVDILTRAGNLRWSEASRHATSFEVEGVPIPTASIDDLIESKRTGRLQDAADIEVLEEIRRLSNS